MRKAKFTKPDTYCMTDLETTGIDHTITDILEIATVVVDFTGNKMVPKKEFHRYIHSDVKPNPQDTFVMENQSKLYAHCNSLPKTENVEKVKNEFISFLKEVYPKQDPSNMYSLPQFCGQNFSAFDVNYLLRFGFLKKGSKDENGKMSANFNYRSLELQSFSIALSKMIGAASSTEFIKYCASLDTEIVLPEGNAHTALYDCYNQIKFYNGMMKLISVDKALLKFEE